MCDSFPYVLGSSPFITRVRSRYKQAYKIAGSTKTPVCCPGPVPARPLGWIPIFFILRGVGLPKNHLALESGLLCFPNVHGRQDVF